MKSIFFLLLFFLFFGCVFQEEQFRNKTLCLSLTSYSFQRIPACNSQEECFNEVEKNLFAFSGAFSGESALALNSYKNNLASSWLYFNKSLSLVKEINRLCETNNFSLLPEKTNELAFFLEKAFDFFDKATLDSFSFVLLEKNFLESEGIELIPEEDLFDDFVLLNQNLNELSVPNLRRNSGSYVSLYFASLRKFNEFSSRSGFYSLYVDEFSGEDLVGFYATDALKAIKSRKFYVPLLKKTFTSVVSFISSYRDLNRSVSALAKMPAHELFSLFGEFASTKNSVASSFSGLVSDIAFHKKALRERNASLSMQIESLASESDSKLKNLSLSSLNEFDSNLLPFLFENLNAEFISSSNDNAFSVDDFVSASKQKLYSLRNEFTELKRKDYFNEVSLGEKTNALKRISLELLSLNESIDYYSNELFGELTVLCDSKAKSIKEQLNKIDFYAEPWSVTSVAARLSVKIASYSETENERKLLYCKQILSLYNDFSSAIKDNEKFSLKSRKEFNECISSLEEIFYSRNIPSFVDSFYSLKALKESSLDSFYISSSCLELKERIKRHLYSTDKEIKEVNSLYLESKNLLFKLDYLSKVYPSFFSLKKIDLFRAKLDEISAHFSSGLLSFDSFKSSSERLSSLKKLNKAMHRFFVSSMQKFLSLNYESRLLPLSEALLGESFNARQKLFFVNPLHERIEAEFSFLSPLISGKVVFLDSCVKKIAVEEGNSRIFVSCIPANGLFVESDLNYLIPFVYSLKLMEATQNKAVFKKTIKVTSIHSVSGVKAVIPLEFDSNAAFALFNSSKIPVKVTSGKAFFNLNEVKNGSEIELFYSVFQPVSLAFSESSRKKIDENTFLAEFSVEVKNNLGFDFNSIEVFLPLNDTAKEIELFDSFSPVRFRKLNDKIVFPVYLSKFQSKKLLLKLKLNDFSEFNSALKLSIISDLSFISSSEEHSAKARELTRKANAASSLEDLLELRKETDLLLSMKNNSIETEFNAIKDSIQAKLNELEESISFIDSIGFSSESNELKSKLSKHKSLLINALSLPKQKATQKLLLINSSLNEFSAENTETFLLNKRDSLFKKAKEISEKLAVLDDDISLNALNRVFEEDNNFLSLFSRKQYFSAGLSLKSIQGKLNEINLSLKEKIALKEKSVKERLLSLNEKRSFLQALFSETKKALSESPFYVAPITRKRISFLEKSINFSPFPFDYNSLEELVLLEEELSEAENKLNETENELTFSLNKMKEDAKVFLLSAKLSNKSTKKISLAEKLFREGKYVDSINASLSSKNTGFSVLGNFTFPLQVYPLIALILLIALKKFFYKKKKKRKQKRQICSYPV
jgi:hypothetical protein